MCARLENARWRHPATRTTDMFRSEPIAKANGCSVVRTYCGHGIHELFHCEREACNCAIPLHN